VLCGVFTWRTSQKKRRHCRTPIRRDKFLAHVCCHFKDSFSQWFLFSMVWLSRLCDYWFNVTLKHYSLACTFSYGWMQVCEIRVACVTLFFSWSPSAMTWSRQLLYFIVVNLHNSLSHVPLCLKRALIFLKHPQEHDEL
jgi:hypothetical protein